MIKFTYLKQPLNKYTFNSPKTREFVIQHCKGKTLNLFAGKHPLSLYGVDEVRVDVDPSMELLTYVMDALDFVKFATKTGLKFDTVVLDPPYSYRKSMELYNGNLNSRFKQVLDCIPDILNPDGTVITFGYHSSVMSGKRGFETVEICLISHGGAQHDTIVSVEKRIQ
jgi:hypothetical protein